MYYKKPNTKQKSKASQDQKDWLAMELEIMREHNEKIQNNK